MNVSSVVLPQILGGFGMELEDEKQDRVAPINIQEAVQHGCAGNEVKSPQFRPRKGLSHEDPIQSMTGWRVQRSSTFRGQSELEWCCCLFDCENNLLSNRPRDQSTHDVADDNATGSSCSVQ